MFSEVAADWSFHIPAHHSHLLVSLHHRCQSQKSPKIKEEQLERCAAVKTRALLQAPALWPNWARLTTRRPLRPRKVEETSRSRDSTGPTIGEAVTGAGATHTFLVHIANKWSGGELVTWSCTFWDRNMFPGNSFFSFLCLPNIFPRRWISLEMITEKEFSCI